MDYVRIRRELCIFGILIYHGHYRCGYGSVFIYRFLLASCYYLLSCGKHFQDHIFSLRREAWDANNSITSPSLIEISVP